MLWYSSEGWRDDWGVFYGYGLWVIAFVDMAWQLRFFFPLVWDRVFFF